MMLGLSKRRVSGLSRPTVRNKETGITQPAFRTSEPLRHRYYDTVLL